MKLRYAYVLSGAYVFLAILFVLGYLKGAGHGPNPFGFLFGVVFSGCRVLDLVHIFQTTNEWLRLMECGVAGFVMYGLIGAALDAMVNRHRR
jgi:hypothetical protein